MKLIKTKSRSNFFSWILYGILTLIFVAIPIIVIHLAFTNIDELVKTLPAFILQFFLGILGLRMILWFIKGTESVSIENDNLILEKSGTFWIKKKRRFELSKIKSIKLNQSIFEKESPSQMVKSFSRQSYIFRLQNTGRIQIVYEKFNTYRFLDNVSIQEAKRIIEQINECR